MTADPPQKDIWSGERGCPFMRIWVPLALGGLIGFAYTFFYVLSAAGGGGASSFGLANSVGLAAVFVGLVAAGFLLRRATPPR